MGRGWVERHSRAGKGLFLKWTMQRIARLQGRVPGETSEVKFERTVRGHSTI